MTGKKVSLSDRFDLEAGSVFLTGTQAIGRLALMQVARDRAEGFTTGGYISGYRGSPLGSLDQQLGQIKPLLTESGIVFQPGLNEDIAATAIWGTQQVQMRGEGTNDGVFGIWYGKGPGVDRSGDAFRHSNLAGTSPKGGVLALMGDDHTCESSTTAHQSEFAFVDAMMPILSPAGVQEILDYGVTGIALSRYAGVWVGLKCVKDTVESTATVDGNADRVKIRLPDDHDLPADGVHIRPGDHPLTQEARLHEVKLPAALAFIRANGLNRITRSGGPNPGLGIAAAGKSYLDVLQAFETLGIDEVRAADLGVRLYKIGCTWPLEPESATAFADGLEQILVVEEKRSIIESQFREILYGTGHTPLIEGKKDRDGNALFPAKGSLDLNDIALAIGNRILARGHDEGVARHVARIRASQKRLAETEEVAKRLPYFCAGCPHNSSTHIPEGSRAYAGIGCHYMVQWMERGTEGYTQMGGEGANWIGEAPFSSRGHVFQNIGDGTYNHSGYLAIRAAKAAGVNITYKILYNDAVAMTGGQKNDGDLTVFDIARQVAAEGANKIAVVTDEPDKYAGPSAWPSGTTVHHRSELIPVQRDLAEIGGLSVLIYDQTCASEKRRRRKRGEFPDPDKRIFINPLVCEGCGDCGVQSNCVAIQPLETEFGRKRQIDQSSCNKDFSCISGFCPSFVTVNGAKLQKKQSGSTEMIPGAPAPSIPALETPKAVLVTGIGGTGVVTIGAIIGQAAHIDGLGCGLIDMAGLAQKGGEVTIHIRLAPVPEAITAIRVPAGGADVVIGGDMVVAGSAKCLAAIEPGRTQVILNSHEAYPGDFARDADYTLPSKRILKAIQDAASEEHVTINDVQKMAEKLLGTALATNMMLLGMAWQKGLLPLSHNAIFEAIRLNGQAVDMNHAAFEWGRMLAHDPETVIRAAAPEIAEPPQDETLETLIARRQAFLTDYQDAAYARRYREKVEAMAERCSAVGAPDDRLSKAAARYLFKLMAIKDEFEVARLYTNGDFLKALKDQFSDWTSLEFHLAPPLLAKEDPETGRPGKMTFGPLMMSGFRILAALRRFRGAWFDPFTKTEERRFERALLADYEVLLDDVTARLDLENYEAAVDLVSYPEHIRGYGPVRRDSAKRAGVEKTMALARFENTVPLASAAE